MSQSYSTYEAKARFSEILRKVRAGQRIVISHRGRDVAQITRIGGGPSDIAARLAELEDRGIITPRPVREGRLKPIARRPGAARRFLGTRE
jgi:prevent-host-death family protein